MKDCPFTEQVVAFIASISKNQVNSDASFLFDISHLILASISELVAFFKAKAAIAVALILHADELVEFVTGFKGEVKTWLKENHPEFI